MSKKQKVIEDNSKPAQTEPSQDEVVQTDVLTGDQIVLGIAGGLVPEKEYEVSADIANVLITKGFATLKTKK
jgi:hypothetical protein